MPLDLASLVRPEHTAVVTSECQNGVVGERAIFPELAAAARAAIPAIARLTEAARRGDVQVVHCLALRRPDGKGSNANARLFAVASEAPVALTPDSDEAALIPELGWAPSDVVLARVHGLSPMAGTDLDPTFATWASARSSWPACRSTSRSPTWSWTPSTPVTRLSYRVTPWRGHPRTTPTQSSTTRCRCWRRSPPPTP